MTIARSFVAFGLVAAAAAVAWVLGAFSPDPKETLVSQAPETPNSRVESAAHSTPARTPQPAPNEIATTPHPTGPPAPRASPENWTAPFPIDFTHGPIPGPGERWTLTTPGGERLELEVRRSTSPGPGDHVLTGTIVSSGGGDFSVASVNGQIAGAVRRFATHSVYNLRPAANGEVHFHRQSMHELGDCATCATMPPVVTKIETPERPRPRSNF